MKKKEIYCGIYLGLAIVMSACSYQTKQTRTAEPYVLVESEAISDESEGLEETDEDDKVGSSEKIRYQELTYDFADAKEGADLLLGNKEYFGKLTRNDLSFRMQKKEVTLEEYMDYSAKQVRDFTEGEKEAVSAGMQRVKDICKQKNYKLPQIEKITFVKTTMQEEAGATAYTHGSQIYVGDAFLSLLGSEDPWVQDYGTTILVHELFHCLTRNDAQFRKDMYKILGFQIQDKEFDFSSEIRERILSNPDVGKHNAYATFRINGKDRECVVVFSTTRPFEKPGDSMFDMNVTGLVPIDDLSYMYSSEEADNFWEIFGRNTEYVIDPEETLADNFSYAILYGVEGMDYKSPQIIKEICDYLEN